MDEFQKLLRSHQRLYKSVKTISDNVFRIEERIKVLHDQHVAFSKEIETIKEHNMDVKSKLITVDACLSKNISERIVKMEEEQKAFTRECVEKTAASNEIIKELRGIIRDGQGTMPSVLARLIMVENSIKRLMEQAVENRNLIEEYSKMISSIEKGLIKVDWDQQSIHGKIGIIVNVAWKIAVPIIGALILWKLGLK